MREGGREGGSPTSLPGFLSRSCQLKCLSTTGTQALRNWHYPAQAKNGDQDLRILGSLNMQPKNATTSILCRHKYILLILSHQLGGGPILAPYGVPMEKGKVHINICMSVPISLHCKWPQTNKWRTINSAQPMRPCMHDAQAFLFFISFGEYE